uniref:Di-haem cytochrome c peroxidase domain-containing protein n=1 Tax=Chryseobacterium endophyticum TaxID=1854762 RepID=A0AAU6WTB2_9FLAO
MGSIWSKTNAPINELLDGNLSKPYGIGNGQSFGSLNLANVTMETTFQAEGMNCFTCHSMNNNLYRTNASKK